MMEKKEAVRKVAYMRKRLKIGHTCASMKSLAISLVFIYLITLIANYCSSLLCFASNICM